MNRYVSIKEIPGLGFGGVVKTATGAHSKYKGTCWNWEDKAYDIIPFPQFKL